MVAVRYPAFSLGLSNLGNTLGDTGVTGTRVILAGVGNITLSEATDLNGGTISISGGGGGGGGAFSAGISDGNSLGVTGLTGSEVALVGGSNVTLSGATAANGGTITIIGASAAAQTVQTQNLFDLTIDGNTAGAGQLVSSGTLTLAGGSNITLSQNGNAISILGGAGETQTAISGVGNSETTYTSGTVNLSGLGAITVRSTTGQAFQLSVAPQSVQPETQTFIGGVVASNTTYTSGTVNIVGSGIVTVQSGTGQRVIVNASQSVQPETQTFLGGLVGSNATYTSGTVTLTGVGGGVTVSSNTGQRIDISVAAPVAQTGTQFSAGVSGGNTSGNSGTVAGRVVMAGGNNITLSGSTNGSSMTITISAANAGGAQTGISGIANSQTTYSSGTVSLSELGAITIRSTTGNQFQFSVNSQSVQPETQTFLGGLAGSNTTYTSGTVTITGVGGGITVSSNTGQRIDLSVAAQSAESQSFGMSNIGNTSGTTGIASGAQVRFLLAGGNNVTLSQSLNGASGTITISAASQSAESQSIGMSNIGNTSGTTGIASGAQVRMLFAGGNNITLSQSLNGASGTITISAPNAQTAVSGIANSQTTYTSGTVSLSELGAITIRSTTGNQFQFSVNSQTVQTQNMVAVTLSGNTSGAQALISSGTMTLAGGNNITVSQAGNAVTISGPNVGGAQTGISALANSETTYTSGSVTFSALGALTIRSTTGQHFQFSVNSQSVQPETQTFIGGLAASNTTYTSGTITITGVGGGITVSSNTGQRIDLSVAAQSAESQSIGMSNIGNTSGTTGIASGAQVRMLFAGGNNITLSQSLNGASGTITISAPNAQTGVSGIANSQTTYTSGTVSLSELGAITIRSTTGNQYQFSVNAQTGTQFSAGISGGNTSGDTGTVGGRVVFAGGNNVTLSGSTNGVSETITISAFTQTVQTQNLMDLTLSGNTAGVMALVSSGTLTLAGGNNITLSQAGNAVTISGGAGGGFSAGMSNIGNTSGDTGITGSRLVLAGGNNITLSQSTNASGGTVTISAPNAQTGISGIANSQTTYTSGTVSMSELGAITIRSTTGNQYQFSVAAQTVESQSIGMSNIGNTSGTTGIASGGQVRFLFAGGNNVTLSQSLNGASGTITISAFNQSVQPETQTFVGGIAASNTTYTSGTITITGVGGGVTVSSNTGQRVDISVAAQTGTQFSMGLSNIGNTAGDTVTVAGRVVLAGSNGITLSGSSNGVSQTITISGITQSVESQSIGASNLGNTLGTSGVASGGQVRAVIIGTSNITVSQSVNGASATLSLIGQPSFSAGLSTGGNTQGNTGISGTRLVLVATNNITMSQATDASGATISISGQSPTGGQFSGGVSTMGNTAGSTGISGSRMVLVGTNNISLSQSTDANGNTISFNNTVSAFQAGISTGGNTAGDTGVTGTRLVLVGDSPVSLSQATGANGATVTIDAPATSSLSAVSGIKISTNGSTISIGYGASLADWENMPRAQASLISHVSAFSKTPIYWNDHLDGDITAKSLAFAISMVTASQPLSLSAHLGVYTIVNSTSAALLGSLSEAYVVSSASSVSLSGVRNLMMTGIGTHATLSSLTYGEYLIGMMFSATATNAMNFSLLGASGGAGPLGGIYPGTNQLSTATNQGIQVMAGRGSTTVNAMPANVSSADLINQGQGASMALHPWIYIRS